MQKPPVAEDSEEEGDEAAPPFPNSFLHLLQPPRDYVGIDSPLRVIVDDDDEEPMADQQLMDDKQDLTAAFVDEPMADQQTMDDKQAAFVDEPQVHSYWFGEQRDDDGDEESWGSWSMGQ